MFVGVSLIWVDLSSLRSPELKPTRQIRLPRESLKETTFKEQVGEEGGSQ